VRVDDHLEQNAWRCAAVPLSATAPGRILLVPHPVNHSIRHADDRLRLMSPLPPVARFETNTGVRIYRLSCQAFPRLVVHAYLVVGAGPITLVDTGSGYGDSTRDLLQGFDAVRREFGEPITPRDVKRILITHGHIDHFGGLAQAAHLFDAEIGIHELDRWVLVSYEERLLVATKAMRSYFEQAGVAAERRAELIEMYAVAKRHMRSVPVDFTLADGQELDGLRFIHTPGHCPGQVCIAIGDVLLSADHVLPVTTPHQSPESITAWTGLGHYLEALDAIVRVDGVRLGLGGHEQPIEDFYGRVEGIRRDHDRKLARMADQLRAPDGLTIQELTRRMYPGVEGWDALLALTEVGAHVEYLYERGRLGVVNLEEVEREASPALRFRAR
jgi:glyoxylase-like metal-dependent hydrolase (beta-lactamase superfamily II)